MFQEPIHQVLEKIKNEPFLKWPSKMVGDPMRCNQNLYCASSWTGSTSIKGLKKTSNWVKVKQRLSLRRGRTLGRTSLITITDQGETLQGNLDLPMRR